MTRKLAAPSCDYIFLVTVAKTVSKATNKKVSVKQLGAVRGLGQGRKRVGSGPKKGTESGLSNVGAERGFSQDCLRFSQYD